MKLKISLIFHEWVSNSPYTVGLKLAWKCLVFFAYFLFLVSLLHPYNTIAKVQEVFLAPGWNLISFQLEPENPHPAVVFEKLIQEGKFQAIWAYNKTTWTWSTWQNATNDILNSFNVVAIQEIQANKGYWIKISDYANLTINGEIGEGILEFQAGWNLVGFPGFYMQDIDEQDIASVFKDQISNSRCKVIFSYYIFYRHTSQ